MATSNNIFDTRNIIKETPKTGNRFLLSIDSTSLGKIITGSPLYNLLCATSTEAKIRQVFGGLMTATGNDSVTGTDLSTVLDLSLLSCTIPSFEFESVELNHFNDSVKHLSKFSAINDISVTFYDYINGSSTMIMLAWQSMVGFKLTGEMGYKEDYVCDMDLHLYGPNRPGLTSSSDSSANGSLTQYKILNAWPRSVDIGDFSYDGAEIKKVIVQFSYDLVIPFKVSGDSDAGDGLKLRSFTNLSSENPNTAVNTAGVAGTASGSPAVNPNAAGVSAESQNTLKNSGLQGITL